MRKSRVSQLEDKINDLFSLLASGNNTQIPRIPNNPFPLTPNSPRVHDIPSQAVDEYGEPCGDKSFPGDTSNDTSVYELNASFRVTREQAVEYIDIFGKEFVPHFPFVALPPMIAPYQLYSKSRFLFWAVMAAVAPMSADAQQEVKMWFRRYMAQHIIVQQEKEVEMLQAILIHLAWYVTAEIWRLRLLMRRPGTTSTSTPICNVPISYKWPWHWS